MDEGELLKIELETADKVCNECVANSTSITSDENKNQICEAQLVSSSSDEIMGGNEQDLINNNEEDCERTVLEITQSDCTGADCNDKTEVSNTITNPNTKPSVEREMICNSDIHSTLKAIPSDDLSKCKGSDELGVSCQQIDREGLLQALLNCIQKATELNDCSTLPHLLHQTAEIYFDEEEYEKAIQFIQLEKLYHQKLLTNLTAIQEHWEVKQKAAMARETSEGKTVKSLDNDRIRKLTEICASHCRPNIPGGKISVSAECFDKNECHFASKEQDACKKITAEYNSSFTDQILGTPRVQTAKCDYASLEVMEEGKENSTVSLQVAVAVGECCAREPAMHAAESSLEEQIETVRAKARTHFDVETEHLYSENIITDESCFQPHATTPCKDMLTATKTIETGCFSDETQVVINAAAFLHEEVENLQHSLKFAGKTTEENEISLKCNETVQFITNGEAMPKHSTHVLQNHIRGNSNDCVQGDWSVQNTSHPKGTVEVDGRTIKQNHTNLVSEMNEDYQQVGSEAEQEVQGSVEFSECQTSQEVSEKQGDEDVEGLSSFKHNVVSSNQKNDTEELMQFNDNSLSLDELAKRIQIEESIRPEGLVSILKKGKSDKEIMQEQQKQSKRRVRFQDPQDTLDQDEVNGDSCLLLVLLCIVTVLLSILGTALYCTFGDLESSVCRDFTTQMDFYYTQFQQGVAKVKHWLLFS